MSGGLLHLRGALGRLSLSPFDNFRAISCRYFGQFRALAGCLQALKLPGLPRACYHLLTDLGAVNFRAFAAAMGLFGRVFLLLSEQKGHHFSPDPTENMVSEGPARFEGSRR